MQHSTSAAARRITWPSVCSAPCCAGARDGHPGAGRTTPDVRRRLGARATTRDRARVASTRRRRSHQVDGPFPRRTSGRSSRRATDGSSRRRATGSRSRGSAGCSRCRCSALLARPRPPIDPARTRIGGTPWWAPPDRSTPARRWCSGCSRRRRCRRRSPTRCSPRPPTSPPTTSASATLGFGVAGVVVRAGIVFALPFAFLADRVGRRRVIRIVAWAAPIVSRARCVGAELPGARRDPGVGRPLGLALDFLIAVAAAEEMPRNSRAYAVSVLAMASGLGAGIAVMALPLADLGDVRLAARVPRHVDLAGRRRRHRRGAFPRRVRFERPHRRRATARSAPVRDRSPPSPPSPTSSSRRRASSRTATSTRSAASTPA